MSEKSAVAAPRQRIQTIADLSESQLRTVRAIPPYGTQPPEVMTRHYPVANFTNAQQLDRELAKVFRKVAVPMLPSAAIPDGGNMFAHKSFGLPLIYVRAKDGTARAFINACRHKGAKLVEDCGGGRAARFTCPYHSWTYGLDGRLLAIARADAFADIDKADYALAELPSREFGGLIWVWLDRTSEPDFGGLNSELESDLEALDVPRAHLYGHKTFTVNANWKLVLEPFMESYHVPRLHASSIGDLFGDVTRIVDRLGPHQRKTAGKVNYQPEMLDIEGENIHKTVTFAYQLFPNAVLITSPYYTSFMSLLPVSERETTVEYFFLTLEPPKSEKAEALYKKSYEIVLDVFGGEDFRAAEISQEGLDAGALEQMTYGGMENTIPMYYDQLDALLEA